MNLGEMVSRCEHRSRDITGILTTKVRWREHLNVAYLEFLAQSEFNLELDHATVSFAAGARSAAMPVGVFRVLSLKGVTDNAALGPIGGWKQIAKQFDLDARGTPSYYKVIGNNLHLFPLPDSGYEVEIFFYGQPEKLVELDDEPILPERYHEALVVGALNMAYKDDHDWESAGRFEKDFQRFVQAALNEFGVYANGEYAPMPRTPRSTSRSRGAF